jgi:hypothetical protein
LMRLAIRCTRLWSRRTFTFRQGNIFRSRRWQNCGSRRRGRHPPELTRDKDSIEIGTQCLSSSLDCNESFYMLYCKARCGTWSSTAYSAGKEWTLMDVLNVGWNNPEDEITHVRCYYAPTCFNTKIPLQDYVVSQQTWQGFVSSSTTM